MAGAGYNIPVSVSDATAQNQTLSFTAGTVFNFGSGVARGDVTTLENTTEQRPTATSAAAQRDASAATAIAEDSSKPTNFVLPAIIVGVAAIGFLLVKKYL